MDTHLRLTRGALFALACAAVGCGDDNLDLSVFLGAFAYGNGEMSARCDGVPNSEPLLGIAVDISQLSAEEIEYVAGPRCRVRFGVQGSKATALSGQSCEMAIEQMSARGTFDFAELVPSPKGLHHFVRGTAEVVLPRVTEAIPCEHYEIDATLERRAE